MFLMFKGERVSATNWQVQAPKNVKRISDFPAAVLGDLSRVRVHPLSLPRFRGPLPHPATRFSAWAPDAAGDPDPERALPANRLARADHRVGRRASSPRRDHLKRQARPAWNPTEARTKKTRGPFRLPARARSLSPTPRPQLACLPLPPLSRFLLRFLRRPVSSWQFLVARAIAPPAPGYSSYRTGPGPSSRRGLARRLPPRLYGRRRGPWSGDPSGLGSVSSPGKQAQRVSMDSRAYTVVIGVINQIISLSLGFSSVADLSAAWFRTNLIQSSLVRVGSLFGR